MENNDIMAKIPAIVVIIGAILTIVAFFVVWTSAGSVDYNGMDLMNDKNNFATFWGKPWQFYIPLICLILGIIAAIAALVSFFVEIPKMYLNIGLIIFGLVILVLAIVFFTGSFTADVGSGSSTFKISDHAGVGIWLALAGGVVIALVGALDIAGIFDKLTGGSSAQ